MKRWPIIPSESAFVDKINLPFFYELGAALKPLSTLNVMTVTRLDIAIMSFPASDFLQRLLDAFPALTICRQRGLDLLGALRTQVESGFGRSSSEWDVPWEQQEKYELSQLSKKTQAFETVLADELSSLATYLITQKGAYSTSHLVEQADSVFPDSVKAKLTPEALEEVRQSGRCLAFDVPTASGFHIMRATEGVLHLYYLAVCKPSATDKLENWGAYIAALNKCPDADVKEVVALLQLVKDQHRNLIMHPELSLNPEEAFRLFEIAKGIIMSMSDRLP